MWIIRKKFGVQRYGKKSLVCFLVSVSDSLSFQITVWAANFF